MIQIILHQSVCGRWCHSVSSITINTNTAWIIVTGGRGMDDFAIGGANITMIVEIGKCTIIIISY